MTSILKKPILPLLFGQTERIKVTGAGSTEANRVLTPSALAFIAKLEHEFGERRRTLLKKRIESQIQINSGRLPDYLPETESIRTGYWKVAECPKDLIDRRVEITGPPDRKMIINALNSGANVYMADFEDSLSPTWENLMRGQSNLIDAVDKTIAVTGPEGKQYVLNESIATLMVRPRGWHLEEKHVLVDGQPVSASLFDFGIFFFHNARKLIERGSGPYFYLPKMESHLEAKLWNDVFLMAQDELFIPRGSIRATALIETILAAFEMHEILYELQDHSAGLNCGRWDYIFSMIKKFRHHPEFLLPDRLRITMMTPFLRSYSTLLIQTCHRHGAHAIGGMAAQIPVKDNAEANEEAFSKVRLDKEREADDGHDGTWVAHPGLVAVAKKVFDEKMQGLNQIQRKREDANITTADLLTVPRGEITEQGVRTNIEVAIRYIASWLSGNGCVPLHNLMEDAATAEISRAQLWQWVHSPNAMFSDHRRINVDVFESMFSKEVADIIDST
ncbi:MAG TPA: malate synthase A, partial [Bacteroidota bacterium]|nr:malate synthase A [Bacteroidota bacterium]